MGESNSELCSNSKLNYKLITQCLQKYITARIDIRNVGNEANIVKIIESSDNNAKIDYPSWFKNAQGQGVVIQSLKGKMQLKAKCSGNGTLVIALKGIDCRDKDNNRIPVWIDFTKFCVNDDMIFTKSHVVCHDKPFKYQLNVVDGEVVLLDVVWRGDNQDALLFSELEQNVNKTFMNIPDTCKRLAIFASFSADGLIHKDVIFYLNELKKVTDGIIFIADNPLVPQEIEKLNNLVIYAQCGCKQGYVFGSYKQGYNWALENGLLSRAEEVVLCNDSCYGPVYPFSVVFDEMETRECDFWGISANMQGNYYLYSYFIAFKKQVFSSQVFKEFMKNIREKDNNSKIMQDYAVKLTTDLRRAGFFCYNYMEFYPRCNIYPITIRNRDLTRKPALALQCKFPFIIKDALIAEKDFNIDGIFNTYKYLESNYSFLLDIIEEACPQDCNVLFDYTFSIIMPTLNRKHIIEKAIDSALRQTYQKFELIIVDDGSTDGTEELIAQKYEKEIKEEKIRYIRANHEGVCKARNKGLSEAKNEWIAYLDTDNLMIGDFLKVFCEAIKNNPNIKLFYAKAECMLGNRVVGHPFNRVQLLQANFIDLGTFVHKREIFCNEGGFDENMTRLVDWDLITTYTENNQIHFIDRSVLLYNDSDDPGRITKKVDLGTNLDYFYKKHGRIKVTTIIIPSNNEDSLRRSLDSAVRQVGGFVHEIFVYVYDDSTFIYRLIDEYRTLYPQLDINSISRNYSYSADNLTRIDNDKYKHYVSFMLQDEYWTVDVCLKQQIEYLQSHPNCGMVFFNESQYDEAQQKFYTNLPNIKLADMFFSNKPLPLEILNKKLSLSNCLFDITYGNEIIALLNEKDPQKIPLFYYLEYFERIGYLRNSYVACRSKIKIKESVINIIGRNFTMNLIGGKI